MKLRYKQIKSIIKQRDFQVYTSFIWKISKFILKIIEFFKIILKFLLKWLKLLKIPNGFSFYFLNFFCNFPLNVLEFFFYIKTKTFKNYS